MATHKNGVVLHQRLNRLSEVVGSILVDAFHYLALFAIGGAIVWSAVHAFIGMAAVGRASIDDILLLFIYLELGAMVGIYFKTNHMPVRFLIYVGITALTRLLVGDIAAHHKLDWGIVVVPAAILLLALANLVVRYGSHRYPSASPGGDRA
jgi:protein PsiE